ncbi:LAME_0F18030g1_1 [Lachancea meyersii CBS 8951]|uniref:LAME_0F18030g1_1 n=1 Tax=Lachancea meyersii CBS 8951 TaxID=1266667 RepID=A0A1G4K0D5_9SACH|nr:LAME_0F18030g1_1 [Lachancea meyersii CBS 8951]
MANFAEELWNSIFTPGTSPQLVIATHISFVLLACCLVWLIYSTRSVHFVALLVIAVLLWATVTWFIAELQHAKLKDNEVLAREIDSEKESGKENEAKTLKGQESSEKKPQGRSTATKTVNKTTKSRKV